MPEKSMILFVSKLIKQFFWCDLRHKIVSQNMQPWNVAENRRPRIFRRSNVMNSLWFVFVHKNSQAIKLSCENNIPENSMTFFLNAQTVFLSRAVRRNLAAENAAQIVSTRIFRRSNVMKSLQIDFVHTKSQPIK